MAIRILPFRQYSDHEVVNLYALTDADVLETTTLADSAGGDAGVFVKVSDGDFNNDPITYQTNTYLGDNSFPFLGGTAMYPQVNLKVTPATSGAGCLGMTLLQTAKNDENGEKLLYNPTKQTELQAALPGQAVPVATRGVFTITEKAIDGHPDNSDFLTIGGGIKISANEGKVTGCDRDDTWAMGSVIGTGLNNNSDFRAPSTGYFSGVYAVVKLNCDA
tara:strand:- start:9954 stop:10610 length:657 start_codon:yes stop_codon:yes gene_type:complete